MNNITFKSEVFSEKEFVIKLRKNVSNYFKTNHISTKGNAAMVIKTIVMVSIYIVPFVIIVTVPMPAIAALGLCVIMGIGIAGTGMSVMHDACHGAYSKRHWVNNVLGGSLYLLGSNVLNWKIQHNVLHHTYTNISGMDEDINEKGPIRLARKTPLKKHHRFQFLYVFLFYGMMTIAKLINDFPNLFKYNKKGLVRQQHGEIRSEFIKMALRKLLYMVIIFGLPLWLTDFKWYQLLIGFVVMHWVASLILSVVFQLAHVVEGAEQPFEDNENYANWHIHQLKTTSDFARNNKLLGWYIGGLNFQIEHHLFPHICHIHYNKIAPIVEKTAQEFGFPYNLKPSFANALSSHIKMLKQLGIE
jgi:linoleoyl-CoA desaturase